MEGFALVVVVVLVVLAFTALLSWRHHVGSRRLAEGRAAFTARDPRWQPTTEVCGVEPAYLAGHTQATPRGDGQVWLVHTFTGPLAVTVGGVPAGVGATCGHWGYEVYEESSDEHSTSSSYRSRTVPFAAAQLPLPYGTTIRLRGESALGRMGVTRGGLQIGDPAFTRRFRIEADDPRLAAALLDPGLQAHLLGSYTGRTIELVGTMLVIGGAPRQRDTSLPSPFDVLPGLQADLADVLSRVPPGFWAAMGSPVR